MEVEIKGVRELARKLNESIERTVQPALVAVGAVLQNIIAPYPAAPTPKRDNQWYERGYGTKYRRKDGTITGRKTSQFLNRSWSVEPKGARQVIVANRATYAKWLHLEQTQTRQHQRTGWITDRTAVDRASASGDIIRIVDTALQQVLKEI